MATPEIMTAEQLAEYLQMDKQTIYRKARSGEIPCTRIGRAVRFEKVLIDAWLRSPTWTEGDRRELRAWAEAWAKEKGLREEDVLRAVEEVRYASDSGDRH